MLVLFGVVIPAANQSLPVVPAIDLNRYAGKWYELARLPNRFERNCSSDITANYALRPDGKIDVRNACKQANGKVKESKGTAKVADKKGPNSKLKVTFFWPFAGDYWILDLDPQYQWVLVGVPTRKYLWILSRSANLDAKTYEQIVAKAQSLGFDTSQLLRVKHG
jgi:apolipoprotein D and lipocalin family protein